MGCCCSCCACCCSNHCNRHEVEWRLGGMGVGELQQRFHRVVQQGARPLHLWHEMEAGDRGRGHSALHRPPPTNSPTQYQEEDTAQDAMVERVWVDKQGQVRGAHAVPLPLSVPVSVPVSVSIITTPSSVCVSVCVCVCVSVS